MRNYLFLISFFFVIFAMGQSNQRTKTIAKASSTNSVKKTNAITHFYRSSFGGVVWNEEMSAEKAGVEDPMIMQLNGFVGGLSYHVPWVRPRLSRFYQMDFAFGSVKGRGNRVTNFDEVSSQTWATIQVAPGLLYKLNQSGEVGLSLPFVYRLLDWKLEGSDLEIDKKNQFSYGLAFIYNHHLNSRHSLQFSMSYQELWVSSLLALKWQYTFKNL